MSQGSSLDPRVRRTRRSLQEALLALAANQDFASISVQEVARCAGINRATFYQHYRDMDDFVAQTVDALFEELTAEERAFVAEHGPVSPDVVPPPLVALFQHVEDRPELYRRLLGGTGSSVFAARLRAFHEGQFLRVWRDLGRAATPGTPPPELRARFNAAAVQGLIGWWLEHGHAESVETMAAWCWHLVGPALFSSVEPAPARPAGD